MSYTKVRDEVIEVSARLRRQAGSGDILDFLPKAQLKVAAGYWKRNDFDPLISFIVENFDTDGGDELIVPTSERLVTRKDVRRLRKMWRGIISNRKSAFGQPITDEQSTGQLREKRESVLFALYSYANALLEIGEVDEANRAFEDVSLFRNGKRRKSSTPPDKRKISEEVFWELIDSARMESQANSEFLENLTAKLEVFGLREIRKFQAILDKKLTLANTWDLFALAFISRGGCSDDEFDYFRGWVVAQGEPNFDSQ